MLQLDWVKCGYGNWCPLEAVDLSSVATFGVYIIWAARAGHPPYVIRVGQGDIAGRLLAHRKDAHVLQYKSLGGIFVTWAAVPARLVDGVERYLAEYWKPLIGDRFPNVPPIAVNRPDAA